MEEKEKEWELGSLLKKAREEKGLTLDDIQEETKIRKKYLEAIEENNFDILPGNVYLKVFIKGYAREVDLDYKKLLKEFKVLNIKEEKESNIKNNYLGGNSIAQKSSKNKKNKNPFKFIFIILLSLLLIGAAVYSYQFFSNSEIRFLNYNNQENNLNIEEESELLELEEEMNENNEEEIGKERESDIEEIDDTDIISSFESDFISDQDTEYINQNNYENIDGIDSEESDRITEIIVSEEFEEQLYSQDLLDEESDIEEISLEEDYSAGEEQEATEESSLISEEEEIDLADEEAEIETEVEAEIDKTLYLEADDTVWITVDLNGENVFSGILEAGDQQEYEIEDNFYIRIGNGSAITATINEESYGPWAGSGEIAEVEIEIEDNEIFVNNLRE